MVNFQDLSSDYTTLEAASPWPQCPPSLSLRHLICKVKIVIGCVSGLVVRLHVIMYANACPVPGIT